MANSRDSAKEHLYKLGVKQSLYRTAQGEVFSTVPCRQTNMIVSLESIEYLSWLRNAYYAKYKRVPSQSEVNAALSQVNAYAQEHGVLQPAALRLASLNGILYLDLANSQGEVVEITPQSWKIITNPPVLFSRPNGMLPLPTPISGGSLDAVRTVLNLSEEDDWRLTVGWVISTLHPDGPYPVLAISGAAGTAKTTFIRLVRSLIDPTMPEMNDLPTNPTDLAVLAKHNWICAFDNISQLDQKMSDALCRLATGTGLSKRKLYSDADIQHFSGKRPIILNGINHVISREDLRDRAIQLALPFIPPHSRRTEAQIKAEFEQCHPEALGAILDAVSAALAQNAPARLPELTRMADATMWVTRTETTLGWEHGSFSALLQTHQRQLKQENSLANPVTSAVVDFLQGKSEWQGTATQLFNELTTRASGRDGWPSDPTIFSKRLSHAESDLQAFDITVERSRQGNGRLIILHHTM